MSMASGRPLCKPLCSSGIRPGEGVAQLSLKSQRATGTVVHPAFTGRLTIVTTRVLVLPV